MSDTRTVTDRPASDELSASSADRVIITPNAFLKFFAPDGTGSVTVTQLPLGTETQPAFTYVPSSRRRPTCSDTARPDAVDAHSLTRTPVALRRSSASRTRISTPPPDATDVSFAVNRTLWSAVVGASTASALAAIPAPECASSPRAPQPLSNDATVVAADT